jgi:hypothetical protein
MPIWAIVVVIFLVFLLASMVKVASEYERFATFTLGRFGGLKGPGLVLKSPDSESKWTKLAIGDCGELVAPEVGSFKKIQVPVQGDGQIKVGSVIRVIGFEGNQVRIMIDPARRTVICEKCGHKMSI